MSDIEETFTIGETRSFATEALLRFLDSRAINGSTIAFRTLANEIQAVAGIRGELTMPNNDPRNARMRNETNVRRLIDTMTGLINEGILAWGHNLDNLETSWLSVTEYGEKVLRGESSPHDPERYLERFQTRVPDASKLVLMYLEESVECFRSNRLLASSVMLGVASEASFEELFDALTNYVTGPQKQKLEDLRNDVSTRRKFEKTMEVLRQFKSNFPDDVKDAIENQMEGLFTLIRKQRNESGHPTGMKLEREEMHGYLLIFPMFCEYIYKLIRWLKANATN